MLTGFHAGVSGILYNEQKLGVISNNAANINTPGFRRSLLMMRTREAPKERGDVHSSVAKRTPKTMGVERTGVFKDYAKTGKLRQTGNDFDLAIDGDLKNAFFTVKRPDPSDQNVYYTRNGTMSLGPADPKNPNSPTVLYLGGNVLLDSNKQPISIDPSLGEMKIDSEGKIRQSGIAVGEVPLYRLDKSQDPSTQIDSNLQALMQKGDSLFQVPDGFEKEFNPMRLHVGQGGIHRLMAQGVQESSNVNMFDQLVEMMATTKASTANTTALKQQLEGLSKLFQAIRS